MNITVMTEGAVKVLDYDGSKSLLERLREADVYVPAYCNGRGVCGKCGVRVMAGVIAVSKEDQAIFAEAQLEKGYRLSCTAYPTEDVTIALLSDDEDDFEILSSKGAVAANDQAADDGYNPKGEGVYGIAVDIGTTTISMDLMDLGSGEVLGSNNRINKQRAFGADVISRIQASNNGQKEALRKSIVGDLVDGFEKLLAETDVMREHVVKIVIGANTTMEHLLLGYSCESLGVFPFDPVDIRTTIKKFDEVFDCDLLPEASVVVMPGISTYVGADIAAGLLSCEFHKAEKPMMLIDLGTNGEMAIGNKDRLLCTSTAAGPAFEGGNISCGIGSVKGAICAVKVKETDPLEIEYTTIADGAPVGICGTGVLDTTAELVKYELVDETGLLDDDYFDDGIVIAVDAHGEEITFTQQDVREIQLAKAAVRAGAEVLVKKYGITEDELDTIYLAGGFGFRLNIEKAVSIGLLPESFADKIKIAGNTSLKGAALCLMDEANLGITETLIDRCDEVSLGSDKDFNEAYMDAMMFEA